MALYVYKFGGTSVGNIERIKAVAEQVKIAHDLGDQIVVVVSAMSGETNRLVALAKEMQAQPNDREMDVLLSTGEQVTVSLLSMALHELGCDACSYTGSQVKILTDSVHTKARILNIDDSRIRTHLHEGKVVVVAGFQGVDEHGNITTLGRGGSDYSASLIGAALQVEAIEIWTDVDGMLTADPRVIPGARLIAHIRFDEAAELASFGAKVLHPSTIAPAVQRSIPVFIYNSHRPDATGTRITFDAPRLPVRAIAGRANVVLVNVKSSAMLGTPGVGRGIFSIFERFKLSVDVIATSEVSVSVTLDAATHLDAVLTELGAFGDVTVERGRGIVAIVGSGLGGHTPSMARALAALGDLRVHMCSLSASAINLTLIVDGDQVHEAMRRLHRAFFEEAA